MTTNAAVTTGLLVIVVLGVCLSKLNMLYDRAKINAACEHVILLLLHQDWLLAGCPQNAGLTAAPYLQS